MSIFKKEHELTVEERDVTTVLRVVNRYAKYYEIDVGCCDESEYDPLLNKWYILFSATDKVWNLICKDLGEIGKIEIHAWEDDDLDICFVKEGP